MRCDPRIGTGIARLNVRTTHYLCWYCAHQLPSSFTSVDKNGQTLRVHIECRAPALAFAGAGTMTQLQRSAT